MKKPQKTKMFRQIISYFLIPLNLNDPRNHPSPRLFMLFMYFAKLVTVLSHQLYYSLCYGLGLAYYSLFIIFTAKCAAMVALTIPLMN
jgi:hypothetical protein